MIFHVYFLEGSGLISVNRTVSVESLLVKDFSQVSKNQTLCVFTNIAH